MQLWKVPRKTPLLAFISLELVAIKRDCSDGTHVASDSLSRLIVSRLQRGWVGGQQAHLSSGPLGFAEGSSTASLFLRSAPRRSDSKESTCNAADPGSIPGLGRPPGERNGNPLQCSCLENPVDRGAWLASFHRVTQSRTWLKGHTAL